MKCPECGSIKIEEKSSERICKNCGLVVEDSLLMNPFLTDSEKERAELPFNSRGGTDNISGKIYKRQWFLSNKEKKNQQIKNTLNLLGDKLRLPSYVINDANILMKKLQDKDFLRGKNTEAITTASLYATTLMHDIVRTHLDFELKTGLKRNELLKQYKKITIELKMKFERHNTTDLIEYYADKLKIKAETRNKAYQLQQQNKYLPNPAYVTATTLIYVASQITQEKISQRELAYVSGIHEVTIRRTMKNLSLTSPPKHPSQT